MTVACVAASTATSATAHSTTTMSLPDFLLPPPGYSLSAAAPLYSAEPGPSEQRLAITSRKSSRTPAGTLRRSHSGIVIALRDHNMRMKSTRVYYQSAALKLRILRRGIQQPFNQLSSRSCQDFTTYSSLMTRWLSSFRNFQSLYAFGCFA